MPFAIDLKFIYEPLTTNEEKLPANESPPPKSAVPSKVKFVPIYFLFFCFYVCCLDDKRNSEKEKSTPKTMSKFFSSAKTKNNRIEEKEEEKIEKNICVFAIWEGPCKNATLSVVRVLGFKLGINKVIH